MIVDGEVGKPNDTQGTILELSSGYILEFFFFFFPCSAGD
jgi:hypothetical protein